MGSPVARVRAPLFSLGASGAFGRVIVFRTSLRGTSVQRMPRIRVRPSQVQTTRRQAFRQAAAAWKGTNEATRYLWGQEGRERHMSGYNLWISEWYTQGITPPGLPVLPT